MHFSRADKAIRNRYLIRFGSQASTDLDGHFFDAETDFDQLVSVPILYKHGVCSVLKNQLLGTAELTIDDTGIAIHPVFSIGCDYSRAIVDMFDAGVVAWSSSSVDYRFEDAGQVRRVTRWRIHEATLTPWPAEPWVLPANPTPAAVQREPSKKPLREPVKVPAGFEDISPLLLWLGNQHDTHRIYSQYIKGLIENEKGRKRQNGSGCTAADF